MKATTNRRHATGPSLLAVKKQLELKEFPNQFAQSTRSHGEIYFWEPGNFHIVNSSALSKTVLSSKDFSADRGAFFISRMPQLDLNLIQDFFSVVKKMMVMSDGATHKRRRQAASKGFDEQILKEFERTVHSSIEKILTDAYIKKSFDFAQDVAQLIPSMILAELFSIPLSDRKEFYDWSNNMTAFFGGASAYQNKDGIKVNHSAKKLRSYFRDLLQERKKSPGSDYVSHLLDTQKKYELTDDELISQAVMMLVAGQVTTTDQMCNNMYLFLSKEGVHQELRKKRELISSAIEEAKRFDPAVTFLFRVAKKTLSLGNQLIEEGDTVFLANHAINRPLSMIDADRFDIHRKGAHHFAYGHGTHYCLGASLGRMQMRILFEKIFHEFPEVKISARKKTKRDHYSLSFSGFECLPLELNKNAKYT